MLHSENYWEERIKTITQKHGLPDDMPTWAAFKEFQAEMETWAVKFGLESGREGFRSGQLSTGGGRHKWA